MIQTFANIFYSLDLTIVLIVAIFFLILEYRPPWWYRSNKSECKKNVRVIPGPFSVPLFGTSWAFALGRYNFNKLHEYYMDMHTKYGDIMKEEGLFNVPIINLFNKKDIEKVIKSSGKYPLRPIMDAMAQYRRTRPDRYASIGLVNEQGEAWYILRNALTPALTSPKTISDFLPQVYDIADDWCNLLKQLRNSGNIVSNLEMHTDRLALEVTCTLVLGRRMGFLLPGEETDVCKSLAAAVRQQFLATRDTYFGLPLYKFYKTDAYKRLIESEETIYKVASELIASADDSTKESVIFQSVLKADIDEREKVAAIIDFIAAGIHTMKNSFLFLLYQMTQDLSVQQNILADPSKAYLKACMSESFRLWPTANSLGRITQEDMELSGYNLKAGSIVVCQSGVACRDECNFERSNEFWPERWLNENKQETITNSMFILSPFGAGRRICPGKRLVESILPLLLEYTLKNFEVENITPLDVQFEFLLSPRGPVSMSFKDRI